MNETIINEISKNLNIKPKQVQVVLSLLEEGNTIPFIARYRKEATGSLDEEVIRSINEVYVYQVNLLKRKEDVIRLIDEKGMLTDELKEEILKCEKLVDVEDLYRPYKEKKKTKASEAIKNGLEPLAKLIMEFKNRDIVSEAKKYINEKVENVDKKVVYLPPITKHFCNEVLECTQGDSRLECHTASSQQRPRASQPQIYSGFQLQQQPYRRQYVDLWPN